MEENKVWPDAGYDDTATRVIWHRLARWPGVPLTGSRFVGSTVALKLDPSELKGS